MMLTMGLSKVEDMLRAATLKTAQDCTYASGVALS